ncbi:hypothetical protein CHR28_03380 [Streptomyces sp. XY006]|nr:hypothetical protein CHR28_03380 [Streptomyces sp. XY006]
MAAGPATVGSGGPHRRTAPRARDDSSLSLPAPPRTPGGPPARPPGGTRSTPALTARRHPVDARPDRPAAPGRGLPGQCGHLPERERPAANALGRRGRPDA